MNTRILTQPKLCDGKNYTLGEELEKLLLSKKPKFTNVSFFFGLVKDNAFEKIFNSIKTYVLNGGNFSFYLSQPQKGNAKKVIDSLLEIGCDVYLFKNTNKDFISDFQYKGAIFESSKKGIILLSSGNFSQSGLYEGYNTITELTYDLSEEKAEFNSTRESIFSESICNFFEHITRSEFNEFFSKDVPSIEEFTHKDVEQAKSIVTSLDDINIDIEINDDVAFSVAPKEAPKHKKEAKVITPLNDEKKDITEPIEAVQFEGTKYFGDTDALDIESMLFSESSKRIPASTHDTNELPKEETTEEGSKIIAKTANLSKTSIFMLQIPKVTKKGINANEIKIPSYLRDLIPNFWGWPKEYSVKKDSNEKARICTFKIVDTLDASNIITDEKVKLFQREGENSFSILSDKLAELDLHENDILRFIKTESVNGPYFTCEIIRTTANEYPIWEQFCTSLLKGSKRKYGMM